MFFNSSIVLCSLCRWKANALARKSGNDVPNISSIFAAVNVNAHFTVHHIGIIFNYFNIGK